MTPNSNQHSELVDAIEAGFDRHFAADLYVPEAREALARLVEQLEARDRVVDAYALWVPLVLMLSLVGLGYMLCLVTVRRSP